MSEAAERNLRKTRSGVVVSDKMDKTIVVAIEDNVKHPSTARSSSAPSRSMSHDEKNEMRRRR